jgi:hypothetical protein
MVTLIVCICSSGVSTWTTNALPWFAINQNAMARKNAAAATSSSETVPDLKDLQAEVAEKTHATVDPVVYDPVKVNNANLVELKVALDDALKRVCTHAYYTPRNQCLLF